MTCKRYPLNVMIDWNVISGLTKMLILKHVIGEIVHHHVFKCFCSSVPRNAFLKPVLSSSSWKVHFINHLWSKSEKQTMFHLKPSTLLPVLGSLDSHIRIEPHLCLVKCEQEQQLSARDGDRAISKVHVIMASVFVVCCFLSSAMTHLSF